MQIPLSSKQALLVVDMQEGLFRGKEPPFEPARLVANVRHLVAAARAANVPILAARHCGPAGSPLEQGSPATRLLPEIEIDEVQDRVFYKTRPSCFSGTSLAEDLKSQGIGEIVICGMKTEYCIDTTCRVAAELGFGVVLVEDAHATVDSTLLPARDIIAHHNQLLSAFARRVRTADLAFN